MGSLRGDISNLTGDMEILRAEVGRIKTQVEKTNRDLGHLSMRMGSNCWVCDKFFPFIDYF